MGLQPENAMDAVHSQLEQSGAIQGLSDQIQGNVNAVIKLCRNLPSDIVRVDTKSKEGVNDSTACLIGSVDSEAGLLPPKDGKTRPGLLQAEPAPTTSPVRGTGQRRVRPGAISTPTEDGAGLSATTREDESLDRWRNELRSFLSSNHEPKRESKLQPTGNDSNIELIKGLNPICLRRELLTRALNTRAPGRSWFSQITGARPSSSQRALDSSRRLS